MNRQAVRSSAPMLVMAAALTALAVLISCGSTQNSLGTTTGPVTTLLTDPPTCGVNSGGPFSHVYVTITRVRAHLSSNAGPDDSSWVDLVDLRTSPRQIDLLSLPTTTCVLTQIGSTTGLPPGNYQQIRFHLLSNTPGSGEATPSPNACGANRFNCVQAADGTISTLELSSEAQTGIKIPPGQIAGGGINLAAGQAADLNIDFDSCASIVRDGMMGGQPRYRLKPTLRAGEVSLNQNAISGTVVDGGTNTLIPGALVLLEQPENVTPPPGDLPAIPIDRVVRATVTGSDGSFVFCPLPAGNYDVAVTAMTISPQLVTTTFNPTIVFGVPVGTSLASLPLVPETALPNGNSSPATITGQLTSAGAAGAAVADVTFSAVQQAAPAGGAMVNVTVPVFVAQSQPPIVATAADQSCPVGTDCLTFSLQVPASNPQVGTFSGGTVTYLPPSGPTVSFGLAAEAASCSSGSLGVMVTVTQGGTTTLSNPLAFTGCQ